MQFAAQGSFGLRAECVSNNYLDEAHALRASQLTALRRIGWSAPTGTPAEASACLQLGSLADEYGQALQKEFGGRTAFEEMPEGAAVQ